MKQVLLVEDDKGLSDGVVLGLTQAPYRITQSFSIEEALKNIRMKAFSLIILDLSLPDGNSYELLKQIRRAVETPVIIMAEKEMRLDQSAGYGMGADDCIIKPFSLSQLRDKMRDIWKQRKREPGKEYRFKSLSFQFDEGRFFKDTEEVRLTAAEKKVLCILVENQGTALAEADLAGQIFPPEEADGKRELAAVIQSLRSKLEDDPARPEFIHTVYGRGYTWKDLQSAPAVG